MQSLGSSGLRWPSGTDRVRTQKSFIVIPSAARVAKAHQPKCHIVVRKEYALQFACGATPVVVLTNLSRAFAALRDRTI